MNEIAKKLIFAMINGIAKKTIFIILIVFWLPLLTILWPYPKAMHFDEETKEQISFFMYEKQNTDKANDAREAIGYKEIGLPIVGELSTAQLNRLKIHWFINLSLFAFGLFSVLYSYKESKGWRIMLASVSVAYLFLGQYDVSWRHIFSPDYWIYNWKFNIAQGISSANAAEYMYREMIFPIIHAIIIAILIINIYMQRNGLTRKSTWTN